MSQPARFRLFTTAPLAQGGSVALTREQAHYLGNVMRARAGESVALFNGRDGEWIGTLAALGKNGGEVALAERRRVQAPEPDLWLLAAPIKKDCIDLVAEKAAELGASALWPVFTRRTVMSRVNCERLTARMVEAAEQCERLSVPDLRPPMALEKALEGWDPARVLLFLDESGSGPPIARALAGAAPPLAVLVGPEGGFAPEERALLARLPFARPVSLGPRILRAETAAIAALSVVQALAGDWTLPPRG